MKTKKELGYWPTRLLVGAGILQWICVAFVVKALMLDWISLIVWMILVPSFGLVCYGLGWAYEKLLGETKQ